MICTSLVMDETVPFVSLAATVGHPYKVHADCDDLQVNKHPLRVQAAIAGGVRKPGAATARRRRSCQSLGSGIRDLGLCWNVLHRGEAGRPWSARG